PEANEQSGNQQDPEQRLAGEGGTDEEELAHEDTERWKTSDCDDAKHETPTEHRVGFSESPHVGDLLRALGLRNVTDSEEDRRLRQRVHGHVQQAGEFGNLPAHATGEPE